MDGHTVLFHFEGDLFLLVSSGPLMGQLKEGMEVTLEDGKVVSDDVFFYNLLACILVILCVMLFVFLVKVL